MLTPKDIFKHTFIILMTTYTHVFITNHKHTNYDYTSQPCTRVMPRNCAQMKSTLINACDKYKMSLAYNNQNLGL